MPVTPRRLWPLLADLVCVLALALGGKNTHDGSDAWWVVLVIAWPFAVAALLGHGVLRWRDWPAVRVWPSGVVVLAATYCLGMALRAASGRGLAPGFLVVAFLFLAVTVLGWRLVASVVRSRRARA